MYRIGRWGQHKIEAVEVVKRTEQFTTYLAPTYQAGKFREVREKHSAGEWFDTWAAAQCERVRRAKANIEHYVTQLEKARSHLADLVREHDPTPRPCPRCDGGFECLTHAKPGKPDV
jgi:hypothetical protein